MLLTYERTVLQVGSFESVWHELQQIESKSARGTLFEMAALYYLRNEPMWASKLQANAANSDWFVKHPRRWRDDDGGTDLLIEDHEKRLWAVQAKCTSEGLGKEGVNNFIMDADGQAHEGILVTTSRDLTGNAWKSVEKTSHLPITVIMWHDLVAWDGWADLASMEASLKEPSVRKEPYSLRPYQDKAVQDVTQSLREHERVQMIMACGTGKTITLQRIMERQNPQRTLVLFPSLMLLKQTLTEFLAQRKQDFSWLAVCSDESVGEVSDDNVQTKTRELGIPDVTTDPAHIKEWLCAESGERRVVFSTYQSSPKIKEALKDTEIGFDLALCDEAHKIASTGTKGATAFTTVLDEEAIPATKRVFTTATPRVYGEAVKNKAAENGTGHLVSSMDDEAKFGKRVVDYTFRQAIQDGVLVDYQILLVATSEEEVYKTLNTDQDIRVTKAGEEVDAAKVQTVTAHLALLKAWEGYDLNSVISYHSSVDKAREFASMHTQYRDQLGLTRIKTGVVTGADPVSKREQVLEILRNPEVSGLVSNARCLTEGVDVPSLNAVVFADPRESTIDIVQAVGRVIRKPHGGGKTVGYIVVPIVAGDEGEQVGTGKYDTLVSVVNAMSSIDEALLDEVNKLKQAVGEGTREAELGDYKITLVGAELELADAFENLTVACLDQLSRRTTGSWYVRLGEVKAFCEKHERQPKNGAKDPVENRLGKWVAKQRNTNHWPELSEEQKNQLRELPEWVEPGTDVWPLRFEDVKAFCTEHERQPKYGAEDPVEKRLGIWVNKQRNNDNWTELSEEKKNQLRELPEWVEPGTDVWPLRFEEVKAFCTEHERQPKGRSEDPAEKSLAIWVNTQRSTDRWPELSEKRKSQLRELPEWVDPRTDFWQLRFEEFKAFYEKHERQPKNRAKDPVEKRLAKWVAMQREINKWPELSETQKNQLRELPEWVEPGTDIWQLRLGEVKAFCDKHERQPKNGAEDPVENRLGKWVSRQRNNDNWPELSEEMMNPFRELPGWVEPKHTK